MQKKLYLLVFLSAFALLAQAQWTATGGPYGGDISRLKIAPNGTLYTVINQKLWKSSNNGDLWSEVIPTNPSSLYLNDIMIDTDGKLYAAYYSQLSSSSDNGVTWITVATNLFQNIFNITRIGSDNVFVVWGSSGVYVSINKGVSWTQLTTLQSSGTPGLWSNVAGDIFYGSVGGGLLKHPYQALTTNWNAANMTQIFTVAPNSVNGMCIDGTTSKIYLSSSGKIYTSINGGTTFADITTTSGLAPTYTYFFGPMAIAPDGSISIFNNGSSKIHKSINQGISWTTTDSPTVANGGQVNSAVYNTASTYFLGTTVGVLRTNDTGANWATKNIGLTGSTTQQIVVANTTGKIIVAKYGSGYTSSVDGGLNWTTTALPNLGYSSKVLKLSDGTILLYGSGYLYRSTDNGATFTSDAIFRNNDLTIVEASTGDLYLNYQLFVNPNSVPKIAKSIDKGLTWNDLAVTGLPATNFYVNYAAIDGTTNMIIHGYDINSGTNKTYKVVGTTASQLTLPFTGGLNNVFFQSNKFYASQFSAYYYTTDLGTTWTTIGFSGNRVFPIKNITYSGIVVSRAGSLYISQDEGGTWANTTLPSNTAYITNIATDAIGDFYASAFGSPVLKFVNELLVDPTTLPPFINFNWQPLKGPYGGRISKIQSSPDGNTLFSVASNRLWKNISGLWSLIDPVVPNGGILDVEVDGTGSVYALASTNPQKVYKSTDLGVSWSPLASSGLPGTGNNIRRIEVLSDGSIIAFGTNGSFGSIYKSSDGGATFTSRFTSTNNLIYGNSTTAQRNPAVSPIGGAVAIFGLPSEGLVSSTDFGTTWAVKSTSSVVDPIKGFVGSYMYDKNGNLIMHTIFDSTIPLWITEIVKSSDNGTTWTVLPTPTISTPDGTGHYSKRIAVLGTGEYLMCIQSRFDCYRSTDGGATWTNIGNVGDVFIWALTQGTTSYVLGSSDAGILKTTDGGLTFTPFSNGIPHPSANEITLLNNKDMVIGATRPYYSSDFGQNLTLATLEPASKYLLVGDSLIGYGSNRRMLKSKDFGKTWAEFGADQLYFSFLTKDATGTGFYGSDGGSLKYSTNLLTWTDIVLSGLPTNYYMSSLVTDSGGVIYAVVQDQDTFNSDVYKIVFGSATKISAAIGTTNPANIRYVNNKAYLYDTRGIIYKSADGEIWTQASAPTGNSLVVANNYLFIPANNSVLWVSRNDGTSWQSVGDVPPSSGAIPVFRNVVINEYDGYAYATLTNSVAKKSANVVIPDDKTKPVVTTFLPANNAINISLKPRLTITFDEITRSVIGKKIRIFDLAVPALPIETIDMSTAIQNYKSWSVTPSTSLSFNKTYFIVIDAGAVTDIFSNAYVGISANSTWRFTTKNSPVVSSLSPALASTGIAVNSTLKITFSEPVDGVSGKNLNLYKSSAPTTVVSTLAATTGVRSGNQLTYTLPTALEFNTAYFVKFDASAFSTIDGGIFSTLTQNTDWTFTTVLPPDTQAPTITFTSDPFSKGAASKVFSATITDNTAVTQAKIFYRSITKTVAETSAVLVLNAGKYEATVPAADFGPMGLEYYFTAGDAANNNARSPLTGYYYSYISTSGTFNPQIPGGLIGVGGAVGNWRMITVPHLLADNKISTVFSELGANDLAKWRMITYKNQTAWDEFPNGFTTFTQGKGYFINVKDIPATGLIVEGATTPSNNKAAPFIVNLNPGWNQIGNPYSFPIKWSEILTANSSPAGVGVKLKKFDGAYIDDPNDKLDVFEGAFILNSNTSAVALTIPIAGSLAGGRIASKDQFDLGEDHWIVPISLKAGERENTFGGVGMHPDALVSVDNHDDFNPPRFLDYMEMKFPHPEHFLKNSTRDVVPTQAEYNWEFKVESNQESPIELTWDNSRFGFNTKELFLYDLQKGILVDMRKQNSYSLDLQKSSAFKVYFGENLEEKIKPLSISLGDAFPNPSKGNVTIPFTLSDAAASYQVALEVYDMVGRKVSTLVDEFFKPGFYSVQWQVGDSFTNGLYTYRITVISETKSEGLSSKIILNR